MDCAFLLATPVFMPYIFTIGMAIPIGAQTTAKICSLIENKLITTFGTYYNISLENREKKVVVALSANSFFSIAPYALITIPAAKIAAVAAFTFASPTLPAAFCAGFALGSALMALNYSNEVMNSNVMRCVIVKQEKLNKNGAENSFPFLNYCLIYNEAVKNFEKVWGY